VPPCPFLTVFLMLIWGQRSTGFGDVRIWYFQGSMYLALRTDGLELGTKGGKYVCVADTDRHDPMSP
jgi:hypothetical protein